MQVCRWATLGLQGGLLSSLVAPLPLTSVVVSVDAAAEAGAMEAAWARAVAQRCHAAYAACDALPTLWTAAAKHDYAPGGVVGWSPPRLSTTAVQFQYSQSAAVEAVRLQSAADGATPSSSSASRESDDQRPEPKRRRMDSDGTCTARAVVAASPLAVNWHCRAAEEGAANGKGRRRNNGGAEVTVGATGLRHGMTAKNRSKAGSRLCRVALYAAVKAPLGSAAPPATSTDTQPVRNQDQQPLCRQTTPPRQAVYTTPTRTVWKGTLGTDGRGLRLFLQASLPPAAGAAHEGSVEGRAAAAVVVGSIAVTAKAPLEAHCAALAAFKASAPFVGWEGVTQRKVAALLGELLP